MLQKYFGKKVKDENMTFEAALSLIEGLKERGALPAKYRLEISVATHTRKNPDYEYVLGTLQNHLAPYQHDFNPNLRGETSVRYVVRDFLTEQTHTFYFDQTFDNLFKKGLSGCKARLKLRLASTRGE